MPNPGCCTSLVTSLVFCFFFFFCAVYFGISTPKEFTSLLMVTIVLDVLALKYLSVESHVSHHHPHAVTEPVKHKWPF